MWLKGMAHKISIISEKNPSISAKQVLDKSTLISTNSTLKKEWSVFDLLLVILIALYLEKIYKSTSLFCIFQINGQVWRLIDCSK